MTHHVAFGKMSQHSKQMLASIFFNKFFLEQINQPTQQLTDKFRNVEYQLCISVIAARDRMCNTMLPSQFQKKLSLQDYKYQWHIMLLLDKQF